MTPSSPRASGPGNFSHRIWAPSFPFDPARLPFFYGWIIVAVATLGMVFSLPGQTMGFSVFTDILMAELGLTRVQLSTAYCIGTMASGFTLPALGRLFDLWGARRMAVYSALATGLVLFYLGRTKRILEGGTALLPGVSPVVLAFAIILLGFYLIRASAQGVLTLTSRNMMGKWFDYHRGTALALSGVVTSFTFSIAPRFLDGLIARFEWYGAWLFLGVLTLTVMAPLGWLFFRDNPEECGLLMDGPARRGRKREAHADSIAHRDYTRPEALRTWAFWTFNFTFSFFAMFYTAFTFHVVSLGEEAGRPRVEMIGYFLPMAVISVLVNLFCGWISSRTRLKYLLLFMNGAGLLGVIGTINLESPWGVAAFVAGNGICGGTFASLTGIVWPRFFGRQWLGAISGVGMSSMVLASGAGPLLFSLSLSVAGNYGAILWICAVIPALLAVASLWADNPQRR